MSQANIPDFWYSILMLNDWEDRKTKTPIPDPPGLNAALLSLYSPTPDGSLALQQGKFISEDTKLNIETDLKNLEAYVTGLKVQLTEGPDYGQLIYDEQLGGISEPEFATTNWGFFVSGAEEHNLINNKDKFSLFSVIAPLPVLYDPNAPPGYKYYIPEFTMKGENLKEFLQLKNSDLGYAGKFPQAEPEAPAQFPENDIGLRPANWEPSGDENLGDVPHGQGYYANKFFVDGVAGPVFNDLPGPDFKNTLMGKGCGGMFDNWRDRVINEISQFRQLFINYGAENGTQLRDNRPLALQYPYFIQQQPTFSGILGYLSTPSMTSTVKGSLTITYDPAGTNIVIDNKNPYLNVLYLKLSWPDGQDPAWWETGKDNIPIYQGSSSSGNSPIPFPRNNKITQIGAPDTGPLIPDGGGVVCFSDAYYEQDSKGQPITTTTYRLLMIFGNSVSNPLNNKTRDIIPGVDNNDESLKEWPISIGPFILELNKLVPNFRDGGSGLKVELYTEDSKGEQEKGYGLNYLDINGFYMQTPLVGKTSLTNPQLPVNKDPILPCGQQRTWYGNLTDPYPDPEPSAFHIDFSRGFDCGQGFPEYKLSESTEGLGLGYSYGYGYGGYKINQDLGFITIIETL